MLRIELGPGDLGRIRFAAAPAPVLETVLLLSELRNRARPGAAGPRDWRARVGSAFPRESRPLLDLAPPRQLPWYLDVLTADAEEAFAAVHDTAASVHADNVARIEKVSQDPVPTWLRRYADGDRAYLDALDRALRSFHTSCLAPRWRTVTDRFHREVDQRGDTMRDFGVSAMLDTLHPGLGLNGDTLEGLYPWDRQVHLDGRGLTIMPSAFWTGHPLVTWDPLDPTRHVLVYPAGAGPARPAGACPGTGTGTGTGTALSALLGTTRAAALNTLRQPRTTSGMADHLNISVSTASAHATALRDAGLVESHRHGRSVEHHLTRLGRTLLNRAG